MDSFSVTRSRIWRLQFSLRLLLLAFTGFAVGFPIWYRWPYEEAFVPGVGAVRVTTWQRQWGGARMKHGRERLMVDDQVLESVTYRHGLRHGPYKSEGVRGQYVNNLKHGFWTQPFRTSTWRMGILDGPMEIRVAAPSPVSGTGKTFPRVLGPDEYRTIKVIFADGRLTHLDGKQLKTAGNPSDAGRLFTLLDTDIPDDITRAELGKPSGVNFVEMPPRDTFLYLSELHGMPILVDPKVDPDGNVGITAEYQGIDLVSLLLLLTAPNNLTCDYRYGALWVTTADDCVEWHDPTGIEKIKPPTGSALARAWNEPIGVDFSTPPLKELLASIEQKMTISIDTTRITDAPSRTPASPFPPGPTTPIGSIRGRPLHHVIGHLLYVWNCRCQLEGDKLVILPPE